MDSPVVNVTQAGVSVSVAPASAEMEPSAASNRESEIRRAMLGIQNDIALTPKEKAQRMQVGGIGDLGFPLKGLFVGVDGWKATAQAASFANIGYVQPQSLRLRDQ